MIIRMVCGVSGSGKTWVCSQLINQYHYMEHDRYLKIADFVDAIVWAAAGTDKPAVIDCPYNETELRKQLEARGLIVRTYFINEPLAVIQQRYLARENKPLPNAAAGRVKNIAKKADKWNAPSGTAEQILEILRQEVERGL